MTEAKLNHLTIHSGDLTADITYTVGPFTNVITIRRFQFATATPGGTSPTLLLNVDDGGTDGAGTTAIADRAAAAVTNRTATIQAENTNASDGYKLAAGNLIVCLLDVGGTSPTFNGSTLVMEFVGGIG